MVLRRLTQNKYKMYRPINSAKRCCARRIWGVGGDSKIKACISWVYHVVCLTFLSVLSCFKRLCRSTNKDITQEPGYSRVRRLIEPQVRGGVRPLQYITSGPLGNKSTAFKVCLTFGNDEITLREHAFVDFAVRSLVTQILDASFEVDIKELKALSRFGEYVVGVHVARKLF